MPTSRSTTRRSAPSSRASAPLTQQRRGRAHDGDVEPGTNASPSLASGVTRPSAEDLVHHLGLDADWRFEQLVRAHADSADSGASSRDVGVVDASSSLDRHEHEVGAWRGGPGIETTLACALRAAWRGVDDDAVVVLEQSVFDESHADHP